jgi:hypothetical protein
MQAGEAEEGFSGPILCHASVVIGMLRQLIPVVALADGLVGRLLRGRWQAREAGRVRGGLGAGGTGFTSVRLSKRNRARACP